MKSLDKMKGLDLEKVAKAIEADAGESLPGLRESLAEAKAGKFAAVHTPEQIAARKRGRPAGTVKADAKVSTTLRVDPDVLEAFKASGKGWQTRVNDVLREAVAAGTVHLVGTDEAAIVAQAAELLASPAGGRSGAMVNPYGDGHAAERIVRFLRTTLPAG